MRLTTQTQKPWTLALVLVAMAALTSAPPASAEPGAWKIDAAHTEVNFLVNHFFTPVSGSFDDFEVDLDYDAENPANSSVEARIKVASINTGNERRDEHLRSADWFEAEQYPYMTFKSTSVEPSGDGLLAHGLLTIKGQSHEIELPIELLGRQQIPEPMREMLGGTREVASFAASTAVGRGEFGVGVGSWASNMIVGGDVKIQILLEAHQS